MYCAKCNLHTEEYGEKCPLCDGPLKADEEAPKKTAQSDGDASPWTRERILEKGKEILGERELEEVLDLEESKEEAEGPQTGEEKALLEEKEQQPPQQGRGSKREAPRGRKSSLALGGVVLFVLVLAVLGYIYLLPKGEQPTLAKTEVAATRKAPAKPAPVIAEQETTTKEQEETSETISQVREGEKASSQTEKSVSPLPDEDVEEVTTTVPGTSDAPEVSEASETPEATETPKASATERSEALETAETPKTQKTAETQRISKTLETPVSPAPSQTPEEQYSIHVASFRVKENAFGLRDSLQKKGYPVLCSRAPIPGKGEWYRVAVGYYSNPEEAQQALSKLASEENFTALKVKATLQPEKPIPSIPEARAQELAATKADTSVSPAIPPKTEKQYAIHVGSFKVEENAFDLRDRLQKKGYPVLCTRVPIPGKGEWYRVEVGYYSNPKEAQQALSKLESEEKIAPVRLVEH